MYLGIGAAGLVGGWVIHAAGVRMLGPAAAAVAAAALLVHVANGRRGARAG